MKQHRLENSLKALPANRHVAVIMGGWSHEREISLMSGHACADALERCGHRVTRIDVDRSIAAKLAALAPDLVFNALHGTFGEDGGIQGVLELLELAYTHSGVAASALAMDKPRAKTLMSAAEIPVAPHVIYPHGALSQGISMPAPFVVKPTAGGSSQGVYIIRDSELPLPNQLLAGYPFGDAVMVEKFIAGRELTCAVLNGRALDVCEIIPVGTEFYDFNSKYSPGASKRVIPAKISSFVYQKIQKLTLAAHGALGCKGVSRADFRYDDSLPEDTGLVCLEVNTQPGMTATSLVPDLAAYAGHSFEELVCWICADASTKR